MDAYQEFTAEFDQPLLSEPVADPTPPAATQVDIGTDERRMHVRAYNYWVSLLEGRDFPSIEDLEPADVSDFASHSVLLDFTAGRDNPALPYIGAAIRQECALGEGIGSIADVPSRSLLSRLTDHYLQIIANRAPIGFEAEFASPRGDTICYRGILMPFSSDGDTIDFIYGVINWKHVADAVPVLPPVADPLELVDAMLPQPVYEEEPAFDDSAPAEAEPVLAADAGLADRLSAARATAESVKSGEGRTRAALYRALSLAYDFAVAARDNPDDYAELLEDSGLKSQARAPMTPVVKLVFGADYDKARLTEFAAALTYAGRQNIALGGFENFIGSQAGGLKALVAAERQARRPEPLADDRTEKARNALRCAPAMSLATLPSSDEFALVIARRTATGAYELVAVVEDEALVERSIRKAA